MILWVDFVHIPCEWLASGKVKWAAAIVLHYPVPRPVDKSYNAVVNSHHQCHLKAFTLGSASYSWAGMNTHYHINTWLVRAWTGLQTTFLKQKQLMCIGFWELSMYLKKFFFTVYSIDGFALIIPHSLSHTHFHSNHHRETIQLITHTHTHTWIFTSFNPS